MKKEVQLIKQMAKENIPLNVVTLEDEGTMRKLYDLHDPNISFNPSYDNTKVNVAISLSSEEMHELLKEQENISDILLHNEYLLFSEIKVIASGKELIQACDDQNDITPAEKSALNGCLQVPASLLKENLKSQSKLPVSRAVRISGKYQDEDDK
ncbi:hypothetical protein NEIG_01826 [Nematocida sp. ERTm5]|uniref:Uncharacterized protein n=1 Tax=Nematocida parisii (strain ERTm3) TaxID=935791 RepID=I3EFM2_NEMP3|nr:uncharacterized protein NEPG_01487 [Nematocida parisii ERTm1]EIJ88019.1 hypothetical protein NEQG_01463 [Nematocida parisii ERTm3]KAI5128418.1 hypothetical protein NEPAR08_1229 [Nematocida parisii]KAI5166842.1 hypothetical protein NEIRO02_1464 [Nematocida sp. AWRm79]KAI5184030.1 hypothetical protein NEIRO03_1497 [Nematocida sp. AWRm78]OAG33341.1 hypothetical protein NEIG_01826 [Nematocida sp. ERTm5]|eukprot:XP_013059315.1 hypothetical protein NEPG_01487 [Nematocida parisii ERTm1]